MDVSNELLKIAKFLEATDHAERVEIFDSLKKGSKVEISASGGISRLPSIFEVVRFSKSRGAEKAKLVPLGDDPKRYDKYNSYYLYKRKSRDGEFEYVSFVQGDMDMMLSSLKKA